MISEFLEVHLEGRRAVVSGAGSGIGRIIADALAARGAQVVVGDNRVETFADCTYPHLLVDFADATQISNFMQQALELLGGLDILVNNVGVAGPTAQVSDLDTEGLRKTLAINIESHVHLTRLGVDALKKSGAGCVINMSSVAGRMGVPNRIPYVISKWGIVGLTKTLSIELGSQNVRVNAILPGLVAGPRLQRVQQERAQKAGTTLTEQTALELKGISLGRFVQAEDIANLALFLASDWAKNISGQTICVDADLQYLS